MDNSKIIKAIIIALALVFLFLFTLFFILKSDKTPDTKDSLSKSEEPSGLPPEDAKNVLKATLGDTDLLLEIAESPEERTKGLSGRETLSLVDGLLFVYPEEDLHGIWMKGMKFPIDIIWFNREKEIIHFESEVHPETFPKAFYPESTALYVLEVSAGRVEKEGWEVGTLFVIEK